MWILVLLLLVIEVARASQQIIYSLPNVTIPTNGSVVYTVVSLTQLGSISNNGVPITNSGGLVSNLSLVTYSAVDPYAFSYIHGGGPCNSTFFYDSFQLSASIFSNGTATQMSVIFGICAQDIQDLPVTRDQNIAINSSDVLFSVLITDADDRVGTKDGKLSTYSFHDVSGLVSAGAGIVFNKTNTSIGIISNCKGTNLVAGTLYGNTSFCFLSNGLMGEDSVKFYAQDKANGTTNGTNTLTFSTRELLVCDGLSTGFACTIYTQENSTVSFPLPSEEGSLIAFPYSLNITTLPAIGTLLYSNGSAVSAGDWISPTTNLNYTSSFGYYNQYYFPDYLGGYATFLRSSGVPIGTCANAANGCPDSFTYIAIQTTDTALESLRGTISVIVQRVIIESMSTCPTYVYSLWPTQACVYV